MHTESFIAGKDASLESSITTMQAKLAALGFHIEERSWLNPVEDVWSVHIRDRDCPLLFTNGKGASQLAARASALGEFFERLSLQLFLDPLLSGRDDRQARLHPLPARALVPAGRRRRLAGGTAHARTARLLQPGRQHRAPTRWSTSTPATPSAAFAPCPTCASATAPRVWFPVNIIGNLYVSNGMSAGNTAAEARTQALSEIFERHIKFRIISEGLCLPDVPEEVIARYPRIAAGIRGLRAAGFGILVKDASLGGQYPVMNVTLLHPARPGLLRQLRRAPALRDRAGARPDRTAAGPRAGFAGRLPGTRLRPGRNRQLAESGNPLRRFQRRHQLELPRRHARLRIRRLELRHHHRRRLRLVGRAHPRRRPRHLHRRLHPSGRLRLPHPGAGHVRDLSGRRPGMGEQQRRQR